MKRKNQLVIKVIILFNNSECFINISGIFQISKFSTINVNLFYKEDWKYLSLLAISEIYVIFSLDRNGQDIGLRHLNDD